MTGQPLKDLLELEPHMIDALVHAWNQHAYESTMRQRLARGR